VERRTIYITQYDMKRLRELLIEEKIKNYGRQDHLKKLETELNRSIVVKPEEIPSTVITMNSKVALIDLETKEEMVYVLVFPQDANISENKISVLAPIGTAMLGYSLGDIIEWKIPAGVTRLQVKSILYQPEAEGHYQL